MKEENKINIYADWIESENQIGTLYVSSMRGKNIYSFEYTENWLYNFSHIMLDPDLYNTKGRQFAPADKKIWGFLSDCLPDRWGRKLLKRKEEILAIKENRDARDLTELDFLVGVNDESRMGGLRFKYADSQNFISETDLYNVPPLETLRKLEQASIEFEKSHLQDDKWLQILLEPGSGRSRALRHKRVNKGIRNGSPHTKRRRGRRICKMNKEWSELNKKMQIQLKKETTFADGIATLFELRNELMQVADGFFRDLSREEFCAIPFLNAEGYHSKTVAYSLWHIFRIEDIVANTLIAGGEQIFFRSNYKERTKSPIITTGNELVKQQIADFSRQLNLAELQNYIHEVRTETEKILSALSYSDLKKKVSAERRNELESLNVVSTDENAIWLIDYWCCKDFRGLIQMPFSRHWIMHIEAALRIAGKVRK